ncbi:MAG: hypothetical protein GY909_12875 [Oligoflexia bacterium]|nr:hypothetical protein [Oligoflexia bacterium]
MKTTTMKWVVTVLFFGLSLVASAAPALKLATYNIRNFGARELHSNQKSTKSEQSSLRWQLNKLNADLIAVQEVVDDREFINFIKSNYSKYGVVLSKCGGNGRQKLGFVYNKNNLDLLSYSEDASLKEYEPCHEGLRPAFIANFKFKKNKSTFTAIGVHLKAGGYPESIQMRAKQYKILSQIIRKQKSKNRQRLIVLGDFNTTEYKSRNQHYRKFVKFVRDNQLTDFSEEVECTSYWNGGEDDGIFHSSLLDHILVSDSFLNQFWTYEVTNHAHCKANRCRQEREESLGFTFKEISDHCPIMATLE